jgi:hypothetical protein
MNRGACLSVALSPEVDGLGEVGVGDVCVEVLPFYHFEAGDGEEVAVGQHLAKWNPASLAGLLDHRQQRAVVCRVQGDTLGHDQMVVGDGDLARVAEREMTSALAQEAGIFVGPLQLLQAALLQPLPPLRQLCQLILPRLRSPRRAHRAWHRRGLRPSANCAVWRGYRATPARCRRGPGRRWPGRASSRSPPPSQFAQTQCSSDLKHLREAVVQGERRTPPKRVQRPINHPRATGKIAQRQVLDRRRSA